MTEPLVLYKTEGRVAVLTLNRPEALNALNAALVNALVEVAQTADLDPDIGAIVLRSNSKAFIAGADIKAMQALTYADLQQQPMFLLPINALADIATPMIAAVGGYALGGGLEVAMMCDTIIASDKAIFGQPEITLGTLPGLGGTQRLTHLIGQSRAMDWILTGRMVSADEAFAAGLVARMVEHSVLNDTALQMATTIANYSLPATKLAKRAVRWSAETALTHGLAAEKSLFEASFALDDRVEGMTAFTEKRTPRWQHR